MCWKYYNLDLAILYVFFFEKVDIIETIKTHPMKIGHEEERCDAIRIIVNARFLVVFHEWSQVEIRSRFEECRDFRIRKLFSFSVELQSICLSLRIFTLFHFDR